MPSCYIIWKNLWGHEFKNDPYGRNIWGTLPQGRADYQFQQHIISIKPDSVSSSAFWPHGGLFRYFEAEVHEKMIKDYLLVAVTRTGKSLFHNSTLENIYSVSLNYYYDY